MIRKCPECGCSVTETLSKPWDENSHGAGIWRCKCGLTFMTHSDQEYYLPSLPHFRMGRNDRVYNKRVPRDRFGEVLPEFSDYHGRMY